MYRINLLYGQIIDFNIYSNNIDFNTNIDITRVEFTKVSVYQTVRKI